jgi:hypothetical protein
VALSRFRQPRYLLLAAVLITLALAAAAVFYTNRAPVDPPMAFSDFLQQVESGAVTHVTFGARSLDVTLSDGRIVETFAPTRRSSRTSPRRISSWTYRRRPTLDH